MRDAITAVGRRDVEGRGLSADRYDRHGTSREQRKQPKFFGGGDERWKMQKKHEEEKEKNDWKMKFSIRCSNSDNMAGCSPAVNFYLFI